MRQRAYVAVLQNFGSSTIFPAVRSPARNPSLGTSKFSTQSSARRARIGKLGACAPRTVPIRPEQKLGDAPLRRDESPENFESASAGITRRGLHDDAGKLDGKIWGCSRTCGFTLAELVCVVGIFSLLLGMFLPAWTAYATWQVARGAAFNIIGALRQARGEAQASGLSHAIHFTPRGVGPASYTHWHRLPDGSWQMGSAISLPDSLDFLAPLEIRFSPSGAPSPTGTVGLMSTSGQLREIAVLVGTGRVRLK